MLPTDKSSNICLDTSFEIGGLQNQNSPSNTWTNQHLYILSDDEIKEGDWVLYNEDNIMQVKSSYDNDVTGDDIWLADSLNGLATQKDFCKKVIATTDSSLTTNSIYGIDSFDTNMFGSKSENIKLPKLFKLPQIPQLFIAYYIYEYNKGNIITDVMVEYEEYAVGNYGLSDGESTIDIRLKINPDNTINISSVKESWSRDEVIELIYQYEKDTLYYGRDGYYNSVNIPKEWIENNLK
jgi:hypothetical protein